MRKILKYILVTILLFSAGLYSLNAGYLSYAMSLPDPELPVVPDDTVPKVRTRFPVAKTVPEEYQDLTKQSPADLKTPDNVKSVVEYDIRTGTYVVRTKLGDADLTTPISLTPEEYQDYSFRKSVQSYYRQKNEEEFQKAANKQFSLTDMQFNIGAAERIFGPGGVRVKTQGSAEVELGLKQNKTKNPSLPERARNRTFFNFDESVQLNVQASVGSKVNFDMNYNTETSFDFDSKKLKLAYTGEEDEIIKSLEAGNVSMTTSNSLINGGAALFGMKADLQFGKLRVNALFAQQESESKTVSSKGGVQTKPFELTIDQYDENRHFFLSHYFRDRYDEAVKNLNTISSPVTISKVEVWVTNKRATYDQARNVVAFADLAEHANISNTAVVSPSGSLSVPYNNTNTLYNTLNQQFAGARDISTVNQALGGTFVNGTEYEEVESARLLDASEYTVNTKLGYISLKTQLQADEVLAVAYNYTYSDGKTYQVGEFSTDNPSSAASCLYVKLLKGITMSPDMPFWDLMMKNIYSLGAYSVQKEKFKLNIMYQSDTTGTYVNYLPEGAIANQILLRVLNLDSYDSNNQPHPDGIYDFIEGVTVLSDNGKIIFPSVEPFGSYLRKKINNDAIADKYVFQELYDSTLTVARQIAEKNKFKLEGEYKASSGAEIQLGASNVARGSVKVTAGGAILTENVDYTVDYTSGVVTILNESIISAGTPVSVSLENQTAYNMQRKTMMGLDLNYQFNPNLMVGATIMHMSEMPLTTKTTMGDEAIKNTLWGVNMSYKGESQWLTNMFDKLPLLNLSKPSQISFNAEFAHLIAGHYENKNTGGYSYLDDFESTQSNFDLSDPYPWQLSSVPYDDGTPQLFPEAGLTNNIDYGKSRALLAWYTIDGLFTRKNSSLRPKYITTKDLSNHYVRAIETRELFPQRQQSMSESNTLTVLNMAYYPQERGPYNLDADNINPDGTLQNPEKRFGGMMRKIDQSDFETANVEYIEFWMLDPFIYDRQTTGGDLYFNLGEISEDILKDEKKFFENGLPIDGDTSKVDYTVWGKVPKQQSTVYAFDNTAGARLLQDVGLNGLSSEEEKEYPAYREYLDKLRQKLNAATLTEMENDPLQLSPFFDPAGDKFHYFRGSDYDSREVDILTRYKRYNGTEGNSKDINDSGERYSTSSKTVPDVEDINQDNTLNKNEKYFEYKVKVTPQDTVVGENFIADKRTSSVRLADGTTESVTWYQFKIPVKQYQRRVGAINDFKTIRFIRMFMTGFREPVVLRFGTLQLVRGEWRSYEQDLSDPKMPPAVKGKLEVSTVNIEENSDRDPVSYTLPPGVSRVLDPSQPQIRQENEQALSLKITDLAPQDARAVYKNTNYDLRQYKRLQLFAHAEAPKLDVNDLADGDLAVFIRLGSDYKNNYYEYEVPLKLTPHGEYNYNNSEHQKIVWPIDNMLNFRLEVLTDLKLERNRQKRSGENGVSFQTVFMGRDPDYENKGEGSRIIRIKGNPSLAEVKTIMIGVRNTRNKLKSGEVWVNELRLTDFNEEGGWAANANLNVALSDLGTVNVGGRIETAGFGALDQSLNERRMEDFKQYNVATSIELGKLFPEKAQVSIPFYYAYSKETYDPKYNPLDQDIKLKDAIDKAETKVEKDSIRSYSQDRTVIKSVSFNNVRVNIKSKNPMPYDPANFTLGYSYSVNDKKNPETEYETTKDYRANFAYSYVPYVKPIKPFDKLLKKNNGYTRYAKQLAFNVAPSINFQTAMMRNYYEIKLRDLTGAATGVTNDIPVTFSQNFYWDRAFSLNWAFTNNLNITFSSGTNARIEEPYVQVNKELNPDGYQLWKDSVKKSIADLGTPMKYDQQFMATWQLPLQLIPVLDWTNASLSYNATYNWDRGATVSEDIEMGNTIKNQRQFDLQANLNLLSLYNKNKYLKKINQKFNNTRATAKKPEKKKKPKLEKEIVLSPDSATVVEHGMFTKKVQITARRTDGRVYRVKFKPINFAQVKILNQDTVRLKLTIIPGPAPTEDFLYKAVEHSARFLMMVRRFNIQFTNSAGMMLPGFRPEIGDIFGQGRSSFGLSPGIGFAFGDVRRSYIDEAYEKGWLITDTERDVNAAVMTSTKNLNIRANLEPITGLKIDLTALRNDTRNTEIQFMYEGMPEITGGNFTMTTIALGSAFGGSGNAMNNYSSKAFDRLLANREIIAQRIESRYSGLKYPDVGFIHDKGLGGMPYNPGTDNVNGVNRNSADVLIPAFLAAYTGKDPKKVGLTAFPSLKSMLPNWRVTYDGLIKIPAVKKYFKSVTLSHQYRCSYSVGAFTSFLNWVDAGQDGLGYIQSILNDNPTPSSPYSISSVSLTEAFSPLLGADATLLNNVTVRADYSTTRNLSLNTTSYQLVEALSKKVTIGLGYKYAEFNKVLKMKKTRDFSNDLTVRLDFSYNKMQSLIRKIDTQLTQATSGNIAKTISFSADYGLSRALTIRAFYDIQINEPLISSASYPTSNSNYGISLRFSLAQ
ncbi:cell surface protein SprA [uncultured Parabacteroides sp.]|uniref:T9SS outer membrane translocon Sov/SprA n=1 Tax=uncultured Parabacteroides sp. TaxID=512312 RepID=UPI0028045B95|nr:cell surface protein SprA [uncultured Parabacteroides sp.]MBD9165838.1 cell surface protein SprA [Parabacteroides johnsonii]